MVTRLLQVRAAQKVQLLNQQVVLALRKQPLWVVALKILRLVTKKVISRVGRKMPNLSAPKHLTRAMRKGTSDAVRKKRLHVHSALKRQHVATTTKVALPRLDARSQGRPARRRAVPHVVRKNVPMSVRAALITMTAVGHRKKAVLAAHLKVAIAAVPTVAAAPAATIPVAARVPAAVAVAAAVVAVVAVVVAINANC